MGESGVLQRTKWRMSTGLNTNRINIKWNKKELYQMNNPIIDYSMFHFIYKNLMSCFFTLWGPVDNNSLVSREPTEP